jgi:DNA-binding NtrC family response regulator
MNTRAQTGTSVVLVMASRDPALDGLLEQLEQLNVALQPVVSLQEFQQLFRRNHPAEVVITGVSLPDGNWCDVLTSTVRAGSSARVLVCSQDADERFWSEAIWRGVYDILVAPFTTEYLQRSVETRYRRGQAGQTGETDPDRGHEAEERPATYEAVPIAIVLAAVA